VGCTAAFAGSLWGEFMLTPILKARTGAGGPELTSALERGAVIVFDDVPFPLEPMEERFFGRPYADGKSKNVSIRGKDATLKGAAGTPPELEALRLMMIRFRSWSGQLVSDHFPAYGGKFDLAGTSYRPFNVDARKLSWRRDDSRLHVDAFPSNPTRHKRILRVFRNMNSAGQPRIWRVGEDFTSMADKFLPRVPPYSRISAKVLAGLGITKSLRSEYDHVMLHLHDELKKDTAYQSNAPQQEISFTPGQTWVTFSDIVLHAAMGGEYMLEQTVHMPVEAQQDPTASPHHILSSKLGRPLH
jgi:3-deoxy-D-manno-oct-2-ulosonic acid (Kdo) hydroxylase